MAAYGPTPIDITSTHPLTPNLRTSTSGVQLHHQSSSSVNKQLLFTPHVGDVMSAVVGVCGADNDQNSDQEETDQTLISTNINDGHPQVLRAVTTLVVNNLSREGYRFRKYKRFGFSRSIVTTKSQESIEIRTE